MPMRAIAFITILGCPLIFSVAGPWPARAQDKASCAALMDSYENASKDMADNWVKGLADFSSSGPARRAAQDANSMASANMALSLMKENRCQLPAHVPSPHRYIQAASACRSELAQNGASIIPESCNRHLWKPVAK
jgi:hypothetical protein